MKSKHIIYDLLRQIYPQTIVGNISLPEKQNLLTWLEKNRLLALFIQLYPSESNTHLNKRWENYQTQLTKLVKILNQTLPNDYLIIKTISSYPHFTSDFDVLVRNKDQISKLRNKLANEKFDIEVDINHQISWTNSQEISHDFIWNHVSIARIDTHEVKVPSPDLDILLRIGHIPFEMGEIRIGELFHIFAQLKHIKDMSLLENEAIHMGWPKTYKRTIKIIDELHQKLFTKTHMVPINFPANLTYWQLFLGVQEKKSWNKVWGGRYILRNRFVSWWTKYNFKK